MGRDGGSLHVRVGGPEVRLASHEGRFPDYQAVLDGNSTSNRALVDLHLLTEALARFTEPVSVSFTPAALVIGDGTEQVTMPASWDGPRLSLTLNPLYITEALQVMVGPDVVVEATGPLRPLTLRSADSGALAVLTMPIRPTGA